MYTIYESRYGRFTFDIVVCLKMKGIRKERKIINVHRIGIVPNLLLYLYQRSNWIQNLDHYLDIKMQSFISSHEFDTTLGPVCICTILVCFIYSCLNNIEAFLPWFICRFSMSICRDTKSCFFVSAQLPWLFYICYSRRRM